MVRVTQEYPAHFLEKLGSVTGLSVKEKSAYVTNRVGTLIDVRNHVSYILKSRTGK